MDTPQTIGDRVRIARHYRGKSQKWLADTTGLSQAFISSIESGARELTRRQHIVAIAEALNVSVQDLTGQPGALGDVLDGAARAAVPDVRMALMTTSLDYAEREPSRPLEQLAKDAYEATRVRVEDRGWDVLGRTLPGLLHDAHAAALRARDRDTALEALVLTLVNTASWLKSIGYVDLAWVAADRSRQAAQLRDDPLWVAYGCWSVSATLLVLGSPSSATLTADRAAEDAPRDGEGLELYGMLRLMSALTSTSTGAGDPTAALAEASEVAERTGEGDAFKLMFGPTNVKLWEMAMTLEAGDPDKVVAIGRDVEPGKIRVAERKAAYHKDMGLALARLKLDAEAIRQLRQAEALDPDRVRNHPIVREAVAGMLARARREAGGRELRGIAHRMGVA